MKGLTDLLRSPIPILSEDLYLMVVLAGHPEDEDWPAVPLEGAAALEQARRECNLAEKNRMHRRGFFSAIRCGVSHGGGQKRPMNLKNTKTLERVLKKLNSLKPFIRFAGFATCTPHPFRIRACDINPHRAI
jgi:hypothetical protein